MRDGGDRLLPRGPGRGDDRRRGQGRQPVGDGLELLELVGGGPSTGGVEANATKGSKGKWVIVDVAGRLVALLVDAVTEVFGTGGADLRPTPTLGGHEDARGFAGVTNYSGGLVFVLDTSRLHDLVDPLLATGKIGPGSRPPGLPQGSST